MHALDFKSAWGSAWRSESSRGVRQYLDEILIRSRDEVRDALFLACLSVILIVVITLELC